jgi:penicillin-binding protein 1A
MHELKMITDKELAAAKKQKLSFSTYVNPARRYRQYTQEVLRLVKEELKTDEIYQDGIRVYTHMDPTAQTLAERYITSGIKSAPKGINQGALVSINVADGGILAMVGGVGPHCEWNRATSPHTAGSAFKPFVYLAALSKGALAPGDLIDDHPLAIRQVGGPTYSPKNYDGDFMGTITIRKAIALSRNTCAVRVAQAVGPGAVADCARQAGITSKLDENLSGSSAVSPLEMANAYATLARAGEFVEPLVLRKITDSDGKPLKEYSQKRDFVFEREPVAQLVDALQDVVEKGTGTRARLFDRPVAGKTGTSDAGKDIWFVGFTPDMVTAVWGGNDDNKPVAGRVTGGGIMAGIWQNYMSAYYRQNHVPVGTFPQPEHPLLEEHEPLHIWPAPSQIINRFFGGWINGPQQIPNVREWGWQGPRRYSDSDDNDIYEDRDYQQRWAQREEERARKKGKKKGIVRKILGWFDD